MDNRHILVIEDDPSVARATQRMLMKSGFDALLADCGEAGERTLRDNHASIDTVLIDYSLPGANGIEVLEHLRGLYPRMRFILMSGYSQECFPQEVMEDDQTGFIQKPFMVGELMSVVNTKQAEWVSIPS